MPRQIPVARRLLLLVAALAATLGALPAAASADSNLVVNGRFQEPAIGAGNWANIGNSLPGWTETTGCGVELWGNGFILPSPYQAQVLEINSDCPSRIQQTIDTVVGQKYLVTYYFGARPDTSASENAIEPAWNGVAQQQQTTTDTTLTQYTFAVTGTGSDVLSFRGLGSSAVGTLLTLVSVTPADQGPQVEYTPADVSGQLGTALMTTGKFVSSDGSALTMAASVGTVTSQPDGSFTWTYTPTAVTSATPVSITATDAGGRSATTTFSMKVVPAPTVTVSGCVTRNPNGTLKTFNAVIANLPAQTVYVFTEAAAGVPVDFTNMYRYGSGTVNGTPIAVVNHYHTAPATLSSVYVKVRPYPNYTSAVLAQAVVPVCAADSTPPVVSAQVSSAPADSGWYMSATTDPTVSWLVSDPESSITSPQCASHTVDFETAGVTYACTATSQGGTTTATSPQIRRDTVAPVLSVPTAPVAFEATGPDGAVGSYTTSASDALSGPGPVLCSRVSGDTFPVGDTTVTCQVADVAGNSTSASFTVRIVDTTPPVVTAAKDQTVEATGAHGAKVSFDAASASDLVDGEVGAGCDRDSDDTFALGTTKVTCSATDGHGNTGTASFTVTVEDTTPPVVKVSDQTVEATSASGAAVDLHASATDTVDGALPAACTPESGSTFELDTTTEVTCTASDAHRNTGTGTASIKVVDTTAPAIDSADDVTGEATGPEGAKVSFPSPNTQDAVDGAGTASCSPAAGSTFPLGDTTVTCSATDAHHNSASDTFTVTVKDTTPPKLVLPSDIGTTATSSQGATVAYAVSSTDVVDGSDPVTCSALSGSPFVLGSTTVTCSATDKAGNTATGSFHVIVTYSWGGFREPVKNNALTGNINRTVPVKFTLTGASAGITNAVGRVLIGPQDKPLSAAASTDGATGIRYTGGQYIYNLSTKGLTAGVYTVRVDLGDGVKRDFTLTLS